MRYRPRAEKTYSHYSMRDHAGRICLPASQREHLVNGSPTQLNWTTWLRLRFHGWYPTRNVWGQLKLPTRFTAFPEAQRILSNYGGLTFGNGDEHTALEPATADDQAVRISECQALLGRSIYPVGYREHQDRAYILVDESGLIYLLEGDELHLLSPSFERGMEFIIRPKLNWQQRVRIILRAAGIEPRSWRLQQSCSETPANEQNASDRDSL